MICYTPTNLTRKSLPRKYQHYFSRMCYMTHIILCRAALDKRMTSAPYREAGYVPLHFRHLQSVLGSRFAGPVRDAMLDLDIIDMTTYSAGRYSRGYKLRQKYKDAKYRAITIKDEGLITSFNKTSKQRLYNTIQKCPIHEYLYDFLTQITIKVPPHIYNGLIDEHKLSVDMITNKQWWFVQCPYDRLHHNISSLPKTLRPFLRLNNRRLV